jgi:CDGSH-type Zn-finger protein
LVDASLESKECSVAVSPEGESPLEKKIIVTEDGPYFVLGGIPLVRKVQVVSECGEPLAWKKEGAWDTGECYVLCRCGNSHEKPFCDGTHCKVDFDGRETADARPTAERQVILPGSEKIIVKRDDTLCSKSGFCGNRLATIDQLVLAAGSPSASWQTKSVTATPRSAAWS